MFTNHYELLSFKHIFIRFICHFMIELILKRRYYYRLFIGSKMRYYSKDNSENIIKNLNKKLSANISA